ncbi:hypothetical protein [Silanimonas lenta]|jgi:aspartate aminotransferase-like enzyme|uniref:hypothetical protein n=1 Tax=Silanimonas lenta TaxID=265429 RepID=UPI002FE11057
MTKLESDVSALRRLFEPWATAPHGPVIWEPEPSDPNEAYKRGLINKAIEVLGAGEAALAGESFRIPDFGESSFPGIQDALAGDAEASDFIQLAFACERVRRSLAQASGHSLR